jgi:hypothetical protein
MTYQRKLIGDTNILDLDQNVFTKSDDYYRRNILMEKLKKKK